MQMILRCEYYSADDFLYPDDNYAKVEWPGNINPNFYPTVNSTNVKLTQGFT